MRIDSVQTTGKFERQYKKLPVIIIFISQTKVLFLEIGNHRIYK